MKLRYIYSLSELPFFVNILGNRTLIVLRPDGKLLRISVDALGSSAGVQAEPICIATNGPVLGVGCQHGKVCKGMESLLDWNNIWRYL